MPIGRRFVVALLVSVAAIVVASPALANGIVTGDDGAGRKGRALVQLEAHRVTAKIRDRVADVTVEQTFHSDADRQLEGTYLFPLPPGAAVRQFAMTMGGKMVVGEVVEAKQARAVYEGIVARRKDPGLLEWVGSGVFRARVFPIEPHADLTIRLEFQEVLAEDAGTLAWRYPLATDRLNGSPVATVFVDVSVESTVDLKAITCPSHPATLVRDGERKVRVTHERAGRVQDRDFLLYLGRSPEDVGLSLVSGKEVAEDGTFMAVLAPRVQVGDGKRVPKDMVYVVDTSGSMQGEKIEQARAALVHGVRSLYPGDRFAIVAFATAVRTFREGFVPATKETQEAAAAWIGTLRAEGGTHIEGALTEALRLRTQDRLPLVVFLTDGQPTVGETRPDALEVRVSAANVSKSRIFTFGVGSDLNVALLDRIAERSGGAREYVAAKEDLEVVTSRFFRKVDSPVLTDVTVDLGGGVYDVYPTRLPDLFAGEQVVLFGRYTTPGARTVTLRGRVGATNVAFSFPAKLSDAAGPDFLARLWAHRKVAFLLDEIRLHGRNAELVDEVIRLATRHAIVTPYTSALVVEDGERMGGAAGAGTARGGRGADREPTIRDTALTDHDETDNDLPTEESLGEAGLSDAPFEGPGANGLIGIGGGAGNRAFLARGGHRDRRGNFRADGGSQRGDDAVDDALRWLAAHQSPDGGWSARDFGAWCDGRAVGGATPPAAARGDRDVAVTGLALLAFLGAGYTNRSEGPFGVAVGKGGKYLRNLQAADGLLGDRGADGFVEGHAITTLALVELYGMTGSSLYRQPAIRALAALLALRQPSGAWGRGCATSGGASADDPSTTAWAALALASARRVRGAEILSGRPPTFALAGDDPDRTLALLSRAGDAGDLTALAAATFLRREGPGAPTEVADRLRVSERLWSATEAAISPGAALDVALCQWTSLGMIGTGGPSRDRFMQEVAFPLLSSRVLAGDFCQEKGSWHPVGPVATGLGRVGATALGALTFEMWHRYEPLKPAEIAAGRAAVGAARPSQGPAPTGPAPSSSEPADATGASDATGTSTDLQRRKDAAAAPVDGRSVRTVAGRTFRLDALGRFVDTSFDGKVTPERVEAFSSAYFGLVASSDEVARILSLGERVVFAVGARWIEVVPAAATAPPLPPPPPTSPAPAGPGTR